LIVKLICICYWPKNNSQGIGAECLHFLQGLRGLFSLRLSLSQVQDPELDCLKRLSALRWLTLWDDDVSETDLDKLKRALPNCAVLTESSTEGLVNENSTYSAKEMMETLNDEGSAS
jgi:hypothetical protein